MTETEIYPIASPDDISKELATRAFYGTSFSPEKRGQTCREDYANTVNQTYAEMRKLATTPEQVTILNREIQRYRETFISKLNAYLSAHSRCLSTMIAGPSGFPVRRAQKANQAADKRCQELFDWSTRARAAIRKAVLDARPAEEKTESEWQALKRDIDRRTVKALLAGKIERLAQSGDVQMTERAVEYIRSKNIFTDRHKIWTFPEIARQVAALREERSQMETEAIAEGDGVKIVANRAEDRVQIVFDAKPAADVITSLKSEGWRWSPANSAWQRKLTNAAKWSAMKLTGLSK